MAKTEKVYCLGALEPSIGAGLEVLLPEVLLPEVLLPEVLEGLPMPDFGGSPHADSTSANAAAVAAKATGLSAWALRGKEDACCVNVFRMKKAFRRKKLNSCVCLSDNAK